MRAASLLIAFLLAFPLQLMAQPDASSASKKLSQEELAQLLAPIALYPDELVSQILMASTYPLEVVQADRWAKSHKQSAGDVLAKQLEKEPWDPSVKSMINFPTVLASMSEKLDVTTKIGDAFLAQEGDVMATIQLLRKKAYDAGNLKTTKEQKIVVEKEVIVIQPANPQVIYVPTYSPTVVYGVWAYPAYPPYYYYPPPPPSYPAYSFAVGVAVGAAWGYAWGNCNWNNNNYGGRGVYVNHNQNININNNIDRSKYQGQRGQGQGGQGRWQHNPEHRKNVAYRDNATAKQFGQSGGRGTAATRDTRGYGDGRGGAAGSRPSAGTMDRGAGQGGAAGSRSTASTADRWSGQGGAAGGKPSAGTMDRGAAGSGRESAFNGGAGNGRQERAASDRGQASRQSASAGNRSMPSSGFGGGGGGGSRSGGGFSSGGSRSGGGGRGGGGRR
jgi:hypothetical protein